MHLQYGLWGVGSGGSVSLQRAEGHSAESSLDHIYVSNNFTQRVKCESIEKTSTDHLPIVAAVESGMVKQKKFKVV